MAETLYKTGQIIRFNPGEEKVGRIEDIRYYGSSRSYFISCDGDFSRVYATEWADKERAFEVLIEREYLQDFIGYDS